MDECKPLVSGEREPAPADGEGGPPLGCLYKVAVAPNQSLTFNLVFRPWAAYKFQFELPLFLMGILAEVGGCRLTDPKLTPE